MPQFLVPIISAIGAAAGGAFGATLIMYSTQIAIGAALLGTMALSSAQASKAKRKARNQFNASQVDRLTNVASTVGPRMLVLGRARVGGHVFFRGSVGTNKEKFVMLIALAAHEIDAVEAIYLNDVQVTLDGSGYVQTAPYLLTRTQSGAVLGTVAPPEAIPGTVRTTGVGGEGALLSYTTYQYYVYVPKARIRAYLGAPGQTAAAQVIADFPSLWTAAHTASGIAYLHCEFWYDETAFPSGLPNVTARVRGAKCFDPRTEITVWTQNPAVLSRHIITHPQFGKRTSLSAAEDARIVAAANACDTAHIYNGASTVLYRASLVVPFGSSARDVLDDLVQSMAGQWAHAAGEFSIKPGVYTAPVLSLGDDDLAVVQSSGGAASQRPISIAVHRARNEKFNVVAPKIWDADQGYKQVSVTPLKASALIERDGAELVQDVDMPAVFYAPQALHVAGVAMRDARDPLVVTVPFKLSAYRAELFDNIELTLARYGWSEKPFMVLGRKWSLEGAIELTLKETAPQIYQPDAEFTVQGYAENTALPNPWDIEPPVISAVSSGTAELILQVDGTIVPRVRVQWAALGDVSLTAVEVQWQPVSEEDWRSVSVPAGETLAFLVGVADGQPIIIRARSRNSLAVSDWGVQQVHEVVGKTESPPAFDMVNVLAQPDGTRQFNFAYTTTARPVDWQGAEIRYLIGTHVSPDWDTMVPLQDDKTHYTASPVEINQLLSGPYTFAFRSRDTSGNASDPAFVQITLPARRLGNVVDEFDEAAEGWAGELTDAEINLELNTIEAINASTWADLTSWTAWLRWSMDAATPIVYTSPVRDLTAVLTCLVDVIVTASGDAAVELRSSETSGDPDADPGEWTAWGAADARVRGRYIQIRVTVSANGGNPVPGMSSLTYVASAPLLNEYINDVDISALTGSYRIGTGDVRVPMANAYGTLLELVVIIQDASAGAWSWQRIDNTLTFGPRLQFKLNGTLADPDLVDFILKGF